MAKKKIVLLQHYFNEIGGVETFLLNFCKKYGKDYDLTLVCRDIGFDNAIEISKNANVICDLSEPIECDICIITSVLVDKEFLSKVKYKEIYQMVHSDWTEMKKFWNWEFKEYDPNTKYISVSETARKSFLKEYKHDSVVIPNLVLVDKVKLRLLSCTRLTEEKGYKRMCQLCDLFDKYNIDYVWDVYGTNPLKYKDYGKMVLHPPLKNSQRIMPNYDYVVQLSDTESFCLTMYESLMQGTPVLVTPFPNATLDIKDGKNGYILPFNMKLTKNDIENIVNNIPQKVTYKQTGVDKLWKEILN